MVLCVCVSVGGGEGVGVRIHTKLRTTDQPYLAHYSYLHTNEVSFSKISTNSLAAQMPRL